MCFRLEPAAQKKTLCVFLAERDFAIDKHFTKIGFEVQKTGDTVWCQHARKTTGESSGFFPFKKLLLSPSNCVFSTR